MRIKYTGGRVWLKVELNRVPYYFTKENNRVVDIKDQAFINHIFSLPNRAEFEVVMEENKEEDQRTVLPQIFNKKKPGRPKKEK